MVDIKIEKKDGKYQLLHKNQLRTSGESKDAEGIKIIVLVDGDTNRKTVEPIIEQGNILHPPLMTRFQLEDEKGRRQYIKGIEIKQSDKITDKETFVARIIGSSDYRERIGPRNKDFYFIVENCFVSLHIQDIEIKDGRTLPYLIVKNMV